MSGYLYLSIIWMTRSVIKILICSDFIFLNIVQTHLFSTSLKCVSEEKNTIIFQQNHLPIYKSQWLYHHRHLTSKNLGRPIQKIIVANDCSFVNRDNLSTQQCSINKLHCGCYICVLVWLSTLNHIANPNSICSL